MKGWRPFVVMVLTSSVLASHALAFFNEAPSWALEAGRRTAPPEAQAAPAVVLLKETTLAIERDGSFTRTLRIATRLLNDSGRRWASIEASYVQGSSRVRSASAWLLRQGASARRSERTDWLDVSSDSFGALYSDVRAKALNFVTDAVVGDVFVAEIQISGDLLFSEDAHGWGLQSLPVLFESYRLELPAGFRATPLDCGSPVPARALADGGRTLTWTLRDRPFLPAEPAAPHYESIHPLLLVRIEPPSGTRFKPIVLRHWNELSAWTGQLNREQCDRNESMGRLAQQLVADAPTDLDKIRVLGRYVRGLRYAAVFKGLGRGLGFQPKKATQVLAQRYGDCKDKANLLCALLREVGIEAAIAAARVDESLGVASDFPSAMQFNHAITAIKVDTSIDLPAVVTTSRGRVLFFDPTAAHTLLGDLPASLQGTFVFVQTPESDAPIQLPVLPPFVGHRFLRRATLAVDADGSCRGNVVIEGIRQAGAALREALFNASTPDALAAFAHQQLGDSFQTGTIRSPIRRDDELTGLCGLTFHLSKTNCFQSLQNAQSLFRVDVFGRSLLPGLVAPERRLPVELRALVLDDDIEFTLARQLVVKELPPPIAFTSAYGTYRREFHANGNTVHLVRRLEIPAKLVPVEEYALLRKFFLDLGKSDLASLILERGE